MTRLIFLYLFLLFFSSVSAQNLVPDPGFEITNEGCIYDNLQLPLEYWINPTAGSPDLYTDFDCGGYLSDEWLFTYGFPYPFEGNNYVGMFIVSYELDIQGREYITTPLIASLEAGSTHEVSFFLARMIFAEYLTDRFGVYFSEEIPWNTESFELLEVEPQLEISGEFMDPQWNEWLLVSFNYVAEGNENYLTIGNFRDVPPTLYFDLNTNSNGGDAYYLFDMVSVEAVVSVEDEAKNDLHFIMQGSRVVFQTQLDSFMLCDIQGRLIAEGSNMASGEFIDLAKFSSGIYVVQTIQGNNRIIEKVWID